jgi:LmbE family N-acetylglucosaminyl deacetylase
MTTITQTGPATTWGELPAATSVMAVTARPGQESAELGGLMLAFRRAGASLSLLCLTRGEAANGEAANGEAVQRGTARLAAVRPWEVQMAASVLGIREVAVANYRDGVLHRYRTADLTERIARAVRQHAPDLLLVIGPEAGDAGDAAVARAATAAAAMAGVPAVARTHQGAPGAWAVSLGDSPELARAIQHAAVAVHASQPDLLPAVVERLELLEDTEALRWLLFPRRTPEPRGTALADLG